MVEMEEGRKEGGLPCLFGPNASILSSTEKYVFCFAVVWLRVPVSKIVGRSIVRPPQGFAFTRGQRTQTD